MQEKQIKLKKQGGVTVLLGLSYIVSMVLSFNKVKNMIYPFSFDNRWEAISNIKLETFNEKWANFVIFDLSCVILVIILSLVLLILFTKQSKYFTNFVIVFFIIRLLILTFTFYFQTVIKGPPTPEILEIASTIVNNLAIPALWIPYLMISEKIRETFIY